MPNSLRCKIKHLCHNGTLTERERDRILKALEQEGSYDKQLQDILLIYGDKIVHLMNHGALHGIDTCRLDGKCEDVIPLEDAIAIVDSVFKSERESGVRK